MLWNFSNNNVNNNYLKQLNKEIKQMLRPTHPASNTNELKCYLWALFHQAQLSEFDFYPRFFKSSNARRFTFDLGLIQGMIYVHSLGLSFFIPDSVWIAYLTAYDVPENLQRDYYVGCPF